MIAKMLPVQKSLLTWGGFSACSEHIGTGELLTRNTSIRLINIGPWPNIRFADGSILPSIRAVLRLMLVGQFLPQRVLDRRDRPEPCAGTTAAFGNERQRSAGFGHGNRRRGRKRGCQGFGGHEVAQHDDGTSVDGGERAIGLDLHLDDQILRCKSISNARSPRLHPGNDPRVETGRPRPWRRRRRRRGSRSAARASGTSAHRSVDPKAPRRRATVRTPLDRTMKRRPWRRTVRRSRHHGGDDHGSWQRKHRSPPRHLATRARHEAEHLPDGWRPPPIHGGRRTARTSPFLSPMTCAFMIVIRSQRCGARSLRGAIEITSQIFGDRAPASSPLKRCH